MERLKLIILSRYFLPAVFVFFALQAVFYAAYIGLGIPSDENYHFGSISYYADQPVLTGPFTHHQDPSTLPIIRAIDRNPDYLFHYLLSLPLRLMDGVGLSQHTEVIMLRLINVVFALLALYVIKKCLDEISNDKVAKNLTILLLSLTGMAVWLAGSINYDNLANLLFLTFVLVTLKVIKKPSALKILLALALATATVLTKHVFAPVLCLGLAATAVFIYKDGYRPVIFIEQFLKGLRTKRLLSVGVIFLTLVCFGLFIERWGVNLVRYHAIQPECTNFFSVEECRTNNVYNRNFRQKRIYTEDSRNALVKDFDPLGFSGQWIYGMYNTLYFQLGDRRFESTIPTRIVAIVLVIALTVTVLLSRRRIRLSKSAGYVLVLAGFYAILLFVYNLNTYISFGEKYAFQGRYLLSVLGFLYFFAILIVMAAYRSRPKNRQKTFFLAWAAVLLLFFSVHFPPYLLAHDTDSSWRETFVLPKEIVD